MLSDEELYHRIQQTEQQIAQLQQERGQDHLLLADALDECARLLKLANTRQVEATDLEARARLIRTKAALSGAVFDASAPGAPHTAERQRMSAPPDIKDVATAQAPPQIPDSFWDATIVVSFPDTLYSPNLYTAESELHDLEVLAYAYENDDRYARASMSDEDALRVWGWIVKQRTGRYPNTLGLIDKKAKRLRRREMGPAAETFDCSVTPMQAAFSWPNRSTNAEDAKSKAGQHDSCSAKGTERNAGTDSLKEGLKETQQHLQDAAQSIQGIARNVQIIANIKKKDLRKWLKGSKNKTEE
jgi:hypothetical protein